MESYRELIDTMAGRPVTIRTIDVGGDKLLSAEARKRNYFECRKEDNPALGLRAIRFTLANPNLSSRRSGRFCEPHPVRMSGLCCR